MEKTVSELNRFVGKVINKMKITVFDVVLQNKKSPPTNCSNYPLNKTVNPIIYLYNVKNYFIV